jgi:hypothetical protein
MAYLDETLNAFGYIFGKFGQSYRSRGTAEILSRNLPAPLAVTRPLQT